MRSRRSSDGNIESSVLITGGHSDDHSDAHRDDYSDIHSDVSSVVSDEDIAAQNIFLANIEKMQEEEQEHWLDEDTLKVRLDYAAAKEGGNGVGVKDACVQLAEYYLENKKYNDALACVLTAIDAQQEVCCYKQLKHELKELSKLRIKGDIGFLEYAAGSLYMHLGNYEMALQYADKAVELVMPNEQAGGRVEKGFYIQRALAYILVSDDNVELAAADFKKAGYEEPEQVVVSSLGIKYNTLGVNLGEKSKDFLQQGNYEKAQKSLLKALKMFEVSKNHFYSIDSQDGVDKVEDSINVLINTAAERQGRLNTVTEEVSAAQGSSWAGRQSPSPRGGATRNGSFGEMVAGSKVSQRL